VKNSDFLEDIYPQHFLYAVTIRSPIAKGRLKFIRYPKLPVNYYFITARNIPGENRLEDTTMPILADNNLSYIGEPVAILIGPDKAKLEEMANECIVFTDEEKAVFTCEEAAENSESEDAHDTTDIIDTINITETTDTHDINDTPYESDSNKDDTDKIDTTGKNDTHDKIDKSNTTDTIFREIHIGNTEEAFVKAGKIVTGSYITGIQDHWYAEPAGAVTWYYNEHENKKNKTEPAKSSKEAKKTLIVRTATQWPYHVKRCVSRVLRMDPSSISVETTSLSMHMDGKLWFPSLIACHAALGTHITKKPIRLILNRKEDFLFSPKRCNTSIDIASIIDEKGNINAAEVDIAVNVGAYGVNSEEILDQVCLGSIGYYNIDNLKIKARAERTNIPPQGPFSGFGLSQGFFAIERHVSQIADMVKQDPAQWRKNHINPNSILPSNSSKNDVSGGDLIDTAVKMGDYYRKWASYEMLRQIHKIKNQDKGDNPRGIGIAVGFQGNGLLYNENSSYNVEVTLTKESRLEIKTSISSSEDYSKIWEKVAMETMSIEPNMLRIVTSSSPDCGPSCASRNITAVTKAVEKCCQAIRKQRFHNPLPITVRRSIKPQYGSFLDGRFTAPAGKQLDISGFIKPGMACAVVEVSIDIVECVPKIRGVWLSVAGGKIISVNRARRSLMRSAVQALGWTFTEDIEYINGKLSKDMYDNFAISSPADIPPINIEFIADNSKEPRGIGELPFSCIPAAFIQAVSQAMDYGFKSIPLKRKEIWEMVRLRNIESPARGSK